MSADVLELLRRADPVTDRVVRPHVPTAEERWASLIGEPSLRQPNRGRWGAGRVAAVAAALVLAVVVLGLLAQAGSRDEGPADTIPTVTSTVVPPEAAVFLDDWVTFDADGSSPRMAITTADDGELDMIVRDGLASVCNGASSTMTGRGGLLPDGAFVVPQPVLVCDDGSVPEALSGSSLADILANLTFTYDATLDQLVDNLGSVWQRDSDDIQLPPTSVEPDPLAGQVNGWVAFSSSRSGQGTIYLVRPGEAELRLEVEGTGASDDACPAWSPLGRRLAFGRSLATSGESQLVIVPVDAVGVTGQPIVFPLPGLDPLPGFGPHPCPVWSPDGRWLAVNGGGSVWVVDSETSEVRELPGFRPTDMDWRPGGDELAIAGDLGPDRGSPWAATPISIYSISTGELRTVGTVEAGYITWSPFGTTLAYTGVDEPPDVSRGALRLVDADGSNERVLVPEIGQANHGIGPVWSPDGEHIVYQRLLNATGERHEVVVVDADDGTETVIDPPQTTDGGVTATWYPYSVSWSPDGTALLYKAWSDEAPSSLVAVPWQQPDLATVLNPTVPSDAGYTEMGIGTEIWGRRFG